MVVTGDFSRAAGSKSTQLRHDVIDWLLNMNSAYMGLTRLCKTRVRNLRLVSLVRISLYSVPRLLDHNSPAPQSRARLGREQHM